MAGKSRAASQQREAGEQERLAALEQQQAGAPAAPAPAAPAPQTDVVAKLKELTELQQSGALTPEQFEAAKQQLLQGQ